MDLVKSSLRVFWLVFGASALVTALALFAPDVLSQSRFVSGIPISTVERIAYPVTGVSGLPVCNSRNSGKTYIFTNSVYDSATCDGAGTWDHYYDNQPVIPPVLSNFTLTNGGGTFTATDLAGAILLSEDARAGDNPRVLEITYPATPFTMTVGFITQQVAGSFHHFGVVIRDSAAAPLRVFGVANNVTPVFWFVQYTTFVLAAASGDLIPLGGFETVQWISFEDDGANRIVTWGRGQKYSLHVTPAVTEVNTTGVTPNRIGVYQDVVNALCGNNNLFIHCDIDGVPCS